MFYLLARFIKIILYDKSKAIKYFVLNKLISINNIQSKNKLNT